MRKTVFLIVPLLIAVIFFLYFPAVEEGRNIVSETPYDSKECGCACILNSRPWYSRFNYWFWLWLVITPILVFSFKHDIAQWKKNVLVLGIIGTCYGLMNLAIHLMWDIRNGPFIAGAGGKVPWQRSWDMPDCANIADGASTGFVLLFGWILSGLYVAFWFLMPKVLRFLRRRLFFTGGL